jgi:hypothetical protein
VRRWAKTCALASAVCWSSACFATDTGNPPAAPEIDHDAVHAVPEGGLAQPAVSFSGPAGAISPARGRVFALPLDRDDAAQSSPVSADGSFALERVPADIGEEVRLFVIDDGLASAPLDLRITSDGAVPAIDGARECVAIAPGRVIPGEVSTVGTAVALAATITNRCAEPVAIERVELRAPGGELALVEPVPVAIAAGEAATLRVSLTPAEAGTIVEGVRVMWSGPPRGRTAIVWVLEAR